MTSILNLANARQHFANAIQFVARSQGKVECVWIGLAWFCITTACSNDVHAQQAMLSGAETAETAEIVAQEVQESIHELIQQLESKTFAGRNSASEKLIAAGSATLRPLARNLERSSPEVVYRSRKIMRAIATRGDETTFLKAAGILKLVSFGTLEGNASFASELEQQWKETRTTRATSLLRESGATVDLLSEEEFFEGFDDFYSVQKIPTAPRKPTVAAPKRLDAEQRIQIIDRILVGSVDRNRDLVFGDRIDTEIDADLAELKLIQQRQIWNNRRNLAVVGQTSPPWGNSVSFDKNWSGDSDAFNQIVSMEKLSSISIQDISFSEERLRALSRIPELQQLTLNQCEISIENLELLAKLEQLTQLNLVNLKCDSDFVESLQRLTNLQTLTIDNCKIGDRDLEELTSIESLLQIFFKNQSLTTKYLNRLEGFKRLRFVGLEGCDFDVATVKALISKRRELTVKATPVAFMGVRGPAGFGAQDSFECVISEVISGSGAELAGIQPNDVVTHVDGQVVENFDDLIFYISQFDVGDQPTIRVRRGVEEIELQTKLSGPSLLR